MPGRRAAYTIPVERCGAGKVGESMRFRAGHGAKELLSLEIGLLGALLTGACCLAAVWLTPWLWLPATALVPVTLIAVFWYPRAYVRSLRGSYDGVAVRVVKGVFWQKETLVPMPALRTFECFTLPLGRLFDCHTVVLRFAGGTALLPLLCGKDAEQLTALLASEETP